MASFVDSGEVKQTWQVKETTKGIDVLSKTSQSTESWLIGG